MKKQSNLSRLLEYAGGYKVLTYLSLVLSAASAIVTLVPFIYIWRILKQVIDVAPDFEKATDITHYGIMAVVFAVIAMLLYIGGLMCSHLAAFRIATNMRIDLTDRISKLPVGTIETMGSGKLRRTITETTGAAETFLAHQLPDKAKAIAGIAGLLALLFVFDWRLGLLSIVPAVLAFAAMSGMTGKNMQQKMTEYQNALSDMSGEAVEYVRGIPVVKTFGQTVYSFKKFKGTIDNYEKWTTAYTIDMRRPMMLYTLAVNSVFVFLIIGAFLLSGKGVDGQLLLNLIFYIIVTPVITVTLTKLMYMSENNMLVEDTLKRIDSILEKPELSVAEKVQSPEDGSVKFDNVTFSYDGKKNALNSVSFEIESGQKAAFVGPSGGGKSTVASLIARFFDVSDGQISIGGADIKAIDKNELMNTVSFVFQQSRLIKASVLDNVKLAKPDASKKEVLDALESAQCNDIIEKLPNGVNTVIGAKGVYLSGGEAQRIAIARAMLKNSPIIVLDEATAFADPDNEVKVQAAIDRLSEGKTVIMIAHRLSTVQGADRIFVLEKGEIKQSGSFEQLKNSSGLFSKMWEEYQKSIAWKVSKEAAK